MRNLYCLAAVLFFTCNNPAEDTLADRFVHIQDPEARAIIRAAIDHAGGMERWEAMKKLNYTKNFKLLLPDGEVEQAYYQVHRYQFDPLRIELISEEGAKKVRTLLENGKYSRTVDGQEVDTDRKTLESTINSAIYVVSLPFKLLDPGSRIEYLGADSLADGRPVDVIQVSYGSTTQPGTSSSDIWRYYFDRPDRKIVANWVKTTDHFSRIENLSYERVGGILFNKERKSYRVDSLGNKLYLRADYMYGDFQVE